MKSLNVVDWLAIVLVVVGAINWGLIGVFKYDLVAKIFGDMSGVSRAVYTVVGVAGLYLLMASMKYARK